MFGYFTRNWRSYIHEGFRLPQADLVLFDAETRADAVGRVAQPLLGSKAGRPSFERPAARLLV
jgi:hypothetical protein